MNQTEAWLQIRAWRKLKRVELIACRMALPDAQRR